MNRRFFIAFAILLLCGCREIFPVGDLHSSSAADISRLILKNGQVVIFDRDFGWYNRKMGTIEGMSDSNAHVVYHLAEINKVETVRGYSIIPAIIVAGMIIGAGIWLIEKVLALV